MVGEAYLVKEPPAARHISQKRTRSCFEGQDSDEEGWSTESERGKLSLSEDGDRRQPPKILVIMSEATREALDPHLTARAQRAWCEDRPLCRRPHHLDLMTHAVYGGEEPRWDGVDEEMIYAWEMYNNWCEECFTGKSHWDEYES